MISNRASTDAKVRQHISNANSYTERYVNKHRRPLEFQPEDLVLLSTANLPLPMTFSRKLAAKWLGPLRVIRRIGPVAY